MTIKKIMHKPMFVDPNTTVTDAAKIMAEKNISSVIVGSAKNPIGMFTERDIARKCVAKKLECWETKVKDLMTLTVTVVNVDTPLEDAIGIMMGRYIRHIPVVNNDGKIIGMLSARKLMNGLRYYFF